MTDLVPTAGPERGSSAAHRSWLTSRRGIAVLLVALVPLATIGPNLGDQGLRTEHVYAILAASALLAAYGPPRHLAIAYWIVAGSWVTVSLVALVGGLIPAESLALAPGRTALEGLGRLGVPILGLIIGAYALAPPAVEHAEGRWERSPLELMMTVVVVMACVNSVVALASVVYDISWLTLFRATADEGRESLPTSEKIDQSGRHGGALVQPFEAGLLYSIALITVIRKWKINAVGWGALAAISALICVGGMVSGSKVFLFGGLPVALAYLAALGVWSPRRMRVIGVGLTLLASVVVAWRVLSVLNRMGAERISGNYLLWNEERPWHNLFAARLDSNGLTMDGAQEAFREAGLFGLGAQGTRWPYDIGVLEFVSVAGWLGVALMAVISMVLLVTSSSRRHERYWLVLALLVVGTNIGGPAFTANRNALVIWVLFGAMLQYRPVQAGGRGPRRRPNA